MIYTYASEDKARYEPFLRQGITVLAFTAPWCGTCRAVKRSMKEIEDNGTVTFLEIDVDQHKDLRQAYKIQGVPVCVLVRDGVIVDRIAGSLNFAELREWLKKNDLRISE